MTSPTTASSIRPPRQPAMASPPDTAPRTWRQRHHHRIRRRHRPRSDQAERRRTDAAHDGGIASIDPTKLARDPDNRLRAGLSLELRPHEHDFRRDSRRPAATPPGPTSIPAYSSVSGPADPAANLDDYYAPEINSNWSLCPASPSGRRVAAPRSRTQAAVLTAGPTASRTSSATTAEGQRDPEPDRRQDPRRRPKRPRARRSSA